MLQDSKMCLRIVAMMSDMKSKSKKTICHSRRMWKEDENQVQNFNPKIQSYKNRNLQAYWCMTAHTHKLHGDVHVYNSDLNFSKSWLLLRFNWIVSGPRSKMCPEGSPTRREHIQDSDTPPTTASSSATIAVINAR